MNGRYWKLGLLISAVISLPGCLATSPEKPYNQSAFEKGNVVLTCGSLGCASSWGSSSANMRSQYDSGQWEELARSVVATNFPYDLAYYYLGRAAEGLGHYEAATNYYRAAQIARKCASFINVCKGLDIPNLAADRLKLVSNRSPAKAQMPAKALMSLADAQARLKSLGMYSGIVDGIYGPKTEKSLKKYQDSIGLPQSGIVDSATTMALAKVTPSASSNVVRKVDKKSMPEQVQDETPKIRSTQAPAAVNSELTEGQEAVLLSKAELFDNPDLFANVIATISRGTRVKLIEWNGEWALVEFDDKKGYVYEDKLR